MKLIKVYSPNGKGSVLCSPARLEYMKANGWTEKPAKEVKSKKKTEEI